MSGELGLNDEHQRSVAAFLRFTRYQRAQRLRSVDACFQDVKDTRLLEETYTAEEVSEMLDSLAEVVRAEVEGELIHAAHTHSLLLARLFTQAQKWHLSLAVDTTDLENQELLEEIKKFEEREAQPGRPVNAVASPKMRPQLAPLVDGEGPVALLRAEMKRLTEDNSELRTRLEQAQDKITEMSKIKTEVSLDLQTTRDELNTLKQGLLSRPTSDDMTQMNDEIEKMRLQLSSEMEVREATEDQLGKDLAVSRQTLLQVKAQLQLAEKELEKKFSQTGAYQNMKKMLNKKNEQIKAMRKKLEMYEPSAEEVVDD